MFFFVARNQNLNVLSLLVRKTRTDWLVNEMRILRPAAGMKRIIYMSLNFCEMRRMSLLFFHLSAVRLLRLILTRKIRKSSSLSSLSPLLSFVPNKDICNFFPCFVVFVFG